MPHLPLTEELFPNTKPDTPLMQLRAISLGSVTFTGEINSCCSVSLVEVIGGYEASLQYPLLWAEQTKRAQLFLILRAL